MRGRGDDGVTLVELLVCIAIMGVVASALAMSFFASTRSIDQSSLRMANTHDSQMAASLFSSDMQSANWLWTKNALPGFETCGSGESLVTFAWPGSDRLTRVATYRVIDQDGERQLIRQLCSAPIFEPSVLTSTVVIAHNLDDTTPTVECFGPGRTLTLLCDGQNVIAAQLTAQAQANGTDPTRFKYILRATRRPSASPRGFVQTKAEKADSPTTNSVPFDRPNTAGNLIVAYVVWDNPDAVNSVTDTRNNVYAPVSPSVPLGANASAQVFYAKNVAGGSNTVTATFATGVNQFGLLYITEYSGIDKTNPFDAASPGGTGTGTNMDSGTVTTTNANDVLVGLGASLNGNVNGPSAGYTSRSSFQANLVEDLTVTATGDYKATTTQSGGLAWVMQLVAFRADVGGLP
jgi:prepilin-type N-terminal cleavage/methylation domain-containing protein